MIVIGVDVHKQTVTAVAVEAGRMLDEMTVAVGSDGLSARGAVACGIYKPNMCRTWRDGQFCKRSSRGHGAASGSSGGSLSRPGYGSRCAR
jgi:hypothetical protein